MSQQHTGGTHRTGAGLVPVSPGGMPAAPRRRRRAGAPALLLAMLLVLGIARPADAQSKRGADERPRPKTWHATAYVRGDIGLRVIDYWSRGANMRARSIIGGHPIVTIIRGGRYLVYDELTRAGLDVARAKGARDDDARRLRPFGFELDEIKRDGGEKIEDVKLGRVDAEIWQLTNAAGRRKLWVTKEAPRVPVRSERFDRASGATIETDYSGWTFDLEMKDPFFSAPSDVSLQRFEYDAFVQWALDGGVSAVPILYPDLLHGGPPG